MELPDILLVQVDGTHGRASGVGGDEPQILNLDLLKLALFQLEVELVLAEVFQDNVCDLAVLLKRFDVDEDVVKVYAHYTLYNEVLKDVVHHCLEGGWAIGESKEHDKEFKQLLAGLEGSLPLISLLSVHIVVTPPNIQFSEVPHLPEVIDELGDEGEGLAILHHQGIKNPVVLDQLERAILLFNEEDQRGQWQLGRAHVTRVQVLLKEGVELVLFLRC
ncbi:hypothetical protein C0993_008449 [Termitomyces sp. T159_Od127]|nr:hypothetical protein C0993_008449 [Termitomyces sp. T159_Od127]